ncbi:MULTISPECIES: hypothetical protein [unclassified Streptomyces]|nr:MULTISPECIES: hypothetical protein [unclassified Streptomyces]
MPGLARMMQGFVYLISCVWMVKRLVTRNCPQCHHLLGRHERRRDGSFRD